MKPGQADKADFLVRQDLVFHHDRLHPDLPVHREQRREGSDQDFTGNRQNDGGGKEQEEKLQFHGLPSSPELSGQSRECSVFFGARRA